MHLEQDEAYAQSPQADQQRQAEKARKEEVKRNNGSL